MCGVCMRVDVARILPRYGRTFEHAVHLPPYRDALVPQPCAYVHLCVHLCVCLCVHVKFKTNEYKYAHTLHKKSFSHLSLRDGSQVVIYKNKNGYENVCTCVYVKRTCSQRRTRLPMYTRTYLHVCECAMSHSICVSV